MIRARVIGGLVVLGFFLPAAGAVAAELISGLSAGEPTQSIPVFDVTGPYKGQRICYVCDFQADPNVLAFFRDTSKETADLIVQLNKLYLSHKARNFKAVVMMVGGAETKAWLEDLSRSAKLEIPLTYFNKGPKDVAARLYKLNPEVENTFLVTTDRYVVTNVSGIAPEEFGQVADATAKMLAAGSSRNRR
ncbi:MAG: hypothetical protein HY701_04265 [Gemmatimonadetes bacterium]|nr:hypothetical protein [Gemmatimonadota bacterium]